MNRLLLLFITFLSSVAATVLLNSSCGRASLGVGEVESTFLVSDESIVIPDDEPEPQAEAASDFKVAAVPPVDSVKFTDSSQALDWLRNSPDWQRYSSGIIPDMVNYNLKYAQNLVNNPYPTFLIVDKASMHIYLFDRYGNRMKKFGIACARNFGTKHAKGDSRTPDGFYSAEGVYNSTEWLYTDDNGYTSPAKGVYGPRFIRVKVPRTNAIGIHGTNAPWSIGSRASHGCVRMRNEDISVLVAYVQRGTPIIISPGPRDMAVNEEEGHPVASVAVEPGGARAVASRPKPVVHIPSDDVDEG